MEVDTPSAPIAPRAQTRRELYGVHFRKRLIVSREYHGMFAARFRVMHPWKNASQYSFLRASVLAILTDDRSVRMQPSTAD